LKIFYVQAGRESVGISPAGADTGQTQAAATSVPCGLFLMSEGPLNTPQAEWITSHSL